MMKNIAKLTDDGFLKILKKYVIIIISLELITRFGIIQIFRFYERIFPFEGSLHYDEIRNVITFISTLALNLIVGIILFKDLDRNNKLTWMLLGLTLLNPWMSIIFFLIWKLTEVKNNA